MCNNCYLLDCEIDFEAKEQEKFEKQLEEDYFAMLSEFGQN